MTDERPEGIVTDKRAERAKRRAGLAAVPNTEAVDQAIDAGAKIVEDIARPDEDAKARHPSGKGAAKAVDNRPPTLAEEVEHFHVVFFGDPGKGKTSHAAAMARMGRVIFVNSEKGLKAGPIRRLGIPLENIEPRPSAEERARGVEITYAFLEELAFEIRDRIGAGEDIVGVVWDTGNDMYQRMLQSVVDASAGDRSGNEWAAEIGDYGDVAQAMRRMIRRYHSLDCHWAVTFHAQRAKDENGAVVVLPNLSDKLLVDMLGYVDAIVYCMTEEDPVDPDGDELYIGFTRPTGKFFAKDRYKLLPKRLATPSMDRVIAYLDESLTSGTDPVQQAVKAKKQAAREQG